MKIHDNVAQKVIVIKPKRVVQKEKSYQGMQNAMGNAFKETDILFLPVLIVQYARNINHSTCVMD